MTEKRAQSYLREISPDKVRRNPDNPRVFFRSEEMDTLMASIRRYGIQVPVSVYEDDGNYVLIDGERRWRCARQLNLQRIPALVQQKPTPLANLLLMFNIHALREQWDYFTIANKLPSVISLFKAHNQDRDPTEQELSEVTGLTRGQIRRCRLLMDLPAEYKKTLEDELSLPKHVQTLSEDFFIEMERALKTVQSRVPSAVPDLNAARDALINKFRKGTIGNITDFRKLSKIATSISNLGTREARVREAVRDILDPKKDTGIQEVFAEQFEIRYDERKVTLSIDSISEYLRGSIETDGATALGVDLRRRLLELRRLIDRVLRS
jgi:ParB family transcriptional regulator, chromosome partitioning protein